MFAWKSKIQGPVAVIGDIHGQVDKLATIFSRLRSLPDFEHRWVVLIGDLVDRGPDPKGAIDLVLEFIQKHPRTTAIMGNHEFAMCSALGWLPSNEGTIWNQRWVDHYNSESTFQSYGAEVGNLDQLNAKVPAAHKELLVGMPWCVEHPQLLFVHAGLDPNLPFAVQLRILQKRDFSLNRPQWLCEKSFVQKDPPDDCPFALVSGHVKVEEAVIRSRRILVDTTGGDSGELSCVLMPEKMIITSTKNETHPGRAASQKVSTGAAPKSSSWFKKIWG